MSPNRWKVTVLACVFAASLTVGPDHPVVTVAKKAPVIATRVVIADPPRIVNPPVAPLAENPPAIAADPQVATEAEIPPAPVAANPPPVTAAQEAPVAVTTSPPTPKIATPAKSPVPVTPVPAAPVTVATASAPAVTTAPPVPDIERPAPPFDRRILAVHNREREGLGLEPLNWNPALAQSAQRWADYLAQTGRFEHAPENHSAPEGENLWAGTKGYYTPEAMVGAWIREKRYFRSGTFPDNSTTGKVEDIGHYTQVVWRATREVGCAEAASAAEDILVCRYAEAGNYRGEQPF